MHDDYPDALHGAELRQKLNLETGKLSWPELQRHFARGAVVIVARELDLVEVAATFAENNDTQTKAWVAHGLIAHAGDTDAHRWQQHTSVFWALVVAPWVLVQELEFERADL